MPWRDVLPVHPAAELFPRPSPEELQQLADDIKANGLQQKVVLYDPGDDADPLMLLDGVTRLDACELADIPVIIDGALNPKLLGGIIFDDVDPVAYVISANIHRRHLTIEQRKDLAAELLKANPEKSDRSVAKVVKLDHKTVAAVRTETEASGEIPHIAPTDRKAPDGSSRARKTPAAKSPRMPRPSRQRARDETIWALGLELKNKPADTIGDFARLLRDIPEQALPYGRRVALARQILEGLGLNLADLIGDVIEHEPAKRGRSIVPKSELPLNGAAPNSTG